jgi:hypothetical protein
MPKFTYKRYHVIHPAWSYDLERDCALSNISAFNTKKAAIRFIRKIKKPCNLWVFEETVEGYVSTLIEKFYDRK